MSRLLPSRQAPIEDVGEQNVLAAAERIGVDAEQAEQARGRGADSLRAALRRRRACWRAGASNDRSTVSGKPALLPGV